MRLAASWMLGLAEVVLRVTMVPWSVKSRELRQALTASLCAECMSPTMNLAFSARGDVHVLPCSRLSHPRGDVAQSSAEVQAMHQLANCGSLGYFTSLTVLNLFVSGGCPRF